MKNYILGTDWWDDCDDIVAVRILSRAHKKGEICLKGVVINACMEYSVPSLEGYLNQEKVFDVPIGIDFKATDFGGNPRYQKGLTAFSSKYQSNDDAEDGVRFYRRMLVESKEPLDIIEIGFLQVIADVLESNPDDISEKCGLELFKEKVSKVWVMAGKWDENGAIENNFSKNARAKDGAERFCRLCPVPVTFLGFEIGVDVITGDNLSKEDFLYKAMCDHGATKGRNSWDPMTVELAITGDEATAGYDVVKGTARVDKHTGANFFACSDLGHHSFVIRRYPASYYKEQINLLIESET